MNVNIRWIFLDKRQATLDAVRAYDQMQYAIDHTDEEIKRACERMTDIGAQRITGLPSGPHDPHATEGKIVDAIDEIDVLKEKYRQAVEYMKWFKPAWEYLSEDERYILEMMCLDNDYGDGAANAVADKLHISRAGAYRKKERALKKLTRLLYGIV